MPQAPAPHKQQQGERQNHDLIPLMLAGGKHEDALHEQKAAGPQAADRPATQHNDGKQGQRAENKQKAEHIQSEAADHHTGFGIRVSEKE